MDIIKLKSSLLHVRVAFANNFYITALGIISECCDSMNIEHSFLWRFFIMFGNFLVCICVENHTDLLLFVKAGGAKG